MIDLESSTIVEWANVKNNLTGQYMPSATVTGALKDGDGNLLGNLSLTYVVGTNATFRGVITTGMVASCSPCQEVTVELTASGGGYTGFRRFKDVCNYRGAV